MSYFMMNPPFITDYGVFRDNPYWSAVPPFTTTYDPLFGGKITWGGFPNTSYKGWTIAPSIWEDSVSEEASSAIEYAKQMADLYRNTAKVLCIGSQLSDKEKQEETISAEDADSSFPELRKALSEYRSHLEEREKQQLSPKFELINVKYTDNGWEVTPKEEDVEFWIDSKVCIPEKGQNVILKDHPDVVSTFSHVEYDALIFGHFHPEKGYKVFYTRKDSTLWRYAPKEEREKIDVDMVLNGIKEYRERRDSEKALEESVQKLKEKIETGKEKTPEVSKSLKESMQERGWHHPSKKRPALNQECDLHFFSNKTGDPLGYKKAYFTGYSDGLQTWIDSKDETNYKLHPEQFLWHPVELGISEIHLDFKKDGFVNAHQLAPVTDKRVEVICRGEDKELIKKIGYLRIWKSSHGNKYYSLLKGYSFLSSPLEEIVQEDGKDATKETILLYWRPIFKEGEQYRDFIPEHRRLNDNDYFLTEVEGEVQLRKVSNAKTRFIRSGSDVFNIQDCYKLEESDLPELKRIINETRGKKIEVTASGGRFSKTDGNVICGDSPKETPLEIARYGKSLPCGLMGAWYAKKRAEKSLSDLCHSLSNNQKESEWKSYIDPCGNEIGYRDTIFN